MLWLVTNMIKKTSITNVLKLLFSLAEINFEAGEKGTHDTKTK